MQLEDRIALADPIAGCGQHHDTDCRIDGVLNLVATGAERDRRASDPFGIETRQDAFTGSGHEVAKRRRRQSIP